MFRKYLFRRSYFRWSFIQKVLCLEGPIFRRSCIQKMVVEKVLYCNTFPSFSFRYRNIFFIPFHFTFLFYFLHSCIIHFFLGYTRMNSEQPMFFKILQVPRALKSERTRVPMFRSSVVLHMRFAMRFVCN